MLWRCWASAEHGIARRGTSDLQVSGYSASGLKFGRPCSPAAIGVLFHYEMSELSLRARSVQCHRKALAQQLYKLRHGPRFEPTTGTLETCVTLAAIQLA